MNFEEDATHVMTDDQLEAIIALAYQQVEMETKVADLEDRLKKAKKDLRGIQEFELPEAMQAAHVTKVSIEGVGEISYTDEIKCSIAKKNAEEAAKWLRDNNHGAIIKTVVSTVIPVGQDNKLDDIISALSLVGLAAEVHSGVHAATLKAFIKELREGGGSIPEDLFGIFDFKKAKIKGN